MSYTSNYIGPPPQERVTCISISGDTICIATRKYIRLFIINNIHNITPTHVVQEENVSLLEIVSRSQAVFFVQENNRRKLRSFYYPLQRESKLSSPPSVVVNSDIVQIKANSAYVIVALKRKMFILNTSNLQRISKFKIEENTDGIISISQNLGVNPYLAYKVSSETGYVQVYDLINKKPLEQIFAHKSPVTAIAMSDVKSLMATSSERGTLIRVFKIPGEKVYEFRRSLTADAKITKLAFSITGEYISCISKTKIVQVFMDREMALQKKPPATRTWLEYVYDTVSLIRANYLDGSRCVAWATLPKRATKDTTCCIYKYNNVFCLLTISKDGLLHVYSMNTEADGPCKFITSYLLTSDCEVTGVLQKISIPNPAVPINEEPGQSSSNSSLSINEESGSSTSHTETFRGSN